MHAHADPRPSYALLLELGGVLKSWRLPEGPSLDPADRRLAIEVDDHPVEYGDFEGVIPEGQPGSGAVLLWDRGTWTWAAASEQSLTRGKLEFDLNGAKLAGRFELVRLHERPGRWLLRKIADEHAATIDVRLDAPFSVASGRGIERVAREAGATQAQIDAATRAQARDGRRGLRRSSRPRCARGRRRGSVA